MKIAMTPKAYWHLQWLCQRTENEVSCMGLFSPQSDSLRVDEVILVKQEVSETHVDLDMEWWADKQVALFDADGIQPWQTNAWIHTHPSGVNAPSLVDEETMRVSFGTWNFAVMIILTKDGHFYARTDFAHEFPCGSKYRYRVPCEMEVVWGEVRDQVVDTDILAQWETEFQTLVKEVRDSWCGLNSGKGRSKNRWREDREEKNNGREVMSYEAICEHYGMDPTDPCSFEAIHGYWPDSRDLESRGLSPGGTIPF